MLAPLLLWPPIGNHVFQVEIACICATEPSARVLEMAGATVATTGARGASGVPARRASSTDTTAALVAATSSLRPSRLGEPTTTRAPEIRNVALRADRLTCLARPLSNGSS